MTYFAREESDENPGFPQSTAQSGPQRARKCGTAETLLSTLGLDSSGADNRPWSEVELIEFEPSVEGDERDP